ARVAQHQCRRYLLLSKIATAPLRQFRCRILKTVTIRSPVFLLPNFPATAAARARPRYLQRTHTTVHEIQDVPRSTCGRAYDHGRQTRLVQSGRTVVTKDPDSFGPSFLLLLCGARRANWPGLYFRK